MGWAFLSLYTPVLTLCLGKGETWGSSQAAGQGSVPDTCVGLSLPPRIPRRAEVLPRGADPAAQLPSALPSWLPLALSLECFLGSLLPPWGHLIILLLPSVLSLGAFF